MYLEPEDAMSSNTKDGRIEAVLTQLETLIPEEFFATIRLVRILGQIRTISIVFSVGTVLHPDQSRSSISPDTIRGLFTLLPLDAVIMAVQDGFRDIPVMI
jgi:hypothetical protein